MRRLLVTLCTSTTALAALAPAAFAHNDGRGFYGATDDKVVVVASFIVIAFFPAFALVMSLIQGRLEKRKYERKAAQKALGARDLRGGW
jgi:hypothetical protein